MGIPPSSHKEPTSIKGANSRQSTRVDKSKFPNPIFQADGRSKLEGKMAEARSYFRIVSSDRKVLKLDDRRAPNHIVLDQDPILLWIQYSGITGVVESTIWYWDGPEEDVLRNKKSGGFLSGSGPILVRDRRIAPKDEDRWQFQGGELKRKDRRYLALDAATCNLKPRNGNRSQRWVLENVSIRNIQDWIDRTDMTGNPVEIPVRNAEIPRNPVGVPSVN